MPQPRRPPATLPLPTTDLIPPPAANLTPLIQALEDLTDVLARLHEPLLAIARQLYSHDSEETPTR